MKAVVIAAGLGSRLKPYTNNLPKSLVPINGISILECQFNVYRSLKVKNINVIVGYKKEKFKFRNINYFTNKNYKKNNILESLFFAKSKLTGNCIISYSDILFKRSVVKKLIKSKDAISIVVDENWKKAYKGRTMHPVSQAENVLFNKSNFLLKAGKNLSANKSNAEFIGMIKLNSRGCELFKKYYKIAKKLFKNKKFYNAKNIQKAYLTDFFNFLIEREIKIRCIKIKNNWMEIDTVQDYKRAQNFFK